MTVWHTEGLFDFDPDAVPVTPPAPEPAAPLHYAVYTVQVTVAAHNMEAVPESSSFMPPAELLEKYMQSELHVRMRRRKVDVYELVALDVTNGPEEVKL